MPRPSSPAAKLIEAFAQVDFAGAEVLVNVARALLKEKKRQLEELKKAVKETD